MKVIDLLNKIANGNIPKRIIYDEYVYIWNNKIENYEREIDIHTTLNWDYIAINCLNEPVEIIEENKKIEKIEKIGFVADGTSLYFNGKYQDGSIHGVTPKEIAFAIKINELIEEINKLKENKYEKYSRCSR